MNAIVLILLFIPIFDIAAQDCATDEMGIKQGPCTEEHGESYILRKANYKDGTLDGPYLIRYEWDKGPYIIQRGNYKDGRLQGIVCEYDVDGKLRSSMTYENGILHGVVTRYSKGRVLTVENYVNGVAHGLWQTFYKNGKPETYFYCIDGVFGDVHYLDKNGGVEKIVKRKKRAVEENM